MPDCSDLSSGSRVRFPVMMTRLMLVAAMVSAGSFQHSNSLASESTAGIGGTDREIPVVGQKRCGDGTRRDREGAKRVSLPCAVQRPPGVWPRAREARIQARQQLERFSNSGEAAQPADAPA